MKNEDTIDSSFALNTQTFLAFKKITKTRKKSEFERKKFPGAKNKEGTKTREVST